ncbi:Ig-like domain-containing protein [uncultured Methanobrevibacter sp.]|uniref:Ig-like domain-containing protein n=1 Tax=uncultured Methanobrevibacter sp. TaxID=253161 RepID=UPI0025D3C26D|nr:Ig-like domain-containing protein [uncultured Methanobrevibacter sp.]
MRIEKIILFLLILLILVNVTNISAAENNTDSLNAMNEDTIEINENINDDDAIAYCQENTTQSEMLLQNQDEDTLSDFSPYSTKITLSIKDTVDFETTGNITMNMHFSFVTPFSDGEFSNYNIHVYENDTLIKKINIGDLNLPEVKPKVTYTADVPFTYTIHQNSYLTTSLFGVYSNTLYFEKVKNTYITALNTTQINIDNTYASNETWNNTLKSLKKALEQASNNGVIDLNNIILIHDSDETVEITKDITITGNNASILLTNTKTAFEIKNNVKATFINMTFSGNSNYIISNNGKLKLINCTFKDNSLGLINNNGELELDSCNIKNILQISQERPSSDKGLIYNNGMLKITDTIFANTNKLPYNLPIETTILKGVIYNRNAATLNDVNFTNINYRLVYNDGKMTLNNTLMENMITAGTSIYPAQTSQKISSKYTYNSYNSGADKTAMNGGAIYNNNNLVILNSIIQNIQGVTGGAIYNSDKLTIENTTLMQSTAANSNGGGIYNTGETIINNSKIMACKVYNKIYGTNNNVNINGGGIYNTGTLNISNTEIKECNAIGAAIYNNHVLNLENSKITQNHPFSYQIEKWVGDFVYLIGVHSGVIYNAQDADAIIKNTLFKDNALISSTSDRQHRYYGTIKNDGNMEIRGSLFDHNFISDWSELYQGDGSINIYNTGKLKIMYSNEMNTPEYPFEPNPIIKAPPNSFLFNADGGKSENYYFTPTFEKDYYPIMFNQTENITLNLALTNGEEIIGFDGWENLLIPLDLNMTVTTVNDRGEYVNITTSIKDKFTFQFSYTQKSAEYIISASILNFKTSAIVDAAKKPAGMTVTYNNITYNDGNNITFHIKVTGNNTTPTGNITFTLNNEKTTVNLTDGECSFTINESLKPGSYIMGIDYNGDGEYFKVLNQNYMFSVYKMPTNITVVAPEVRYGETGRITITITPSSAKLSGKLYVNGVYTKDASTQSTRTLTINRNVGVYNITVIFDEDEYYQSGSASTLFVVSKWKTNITLSANDVKEGEANATVNITITPGDVRGEAILIINGVNDTIFLNNTVTPITITNLENGIYHVSVYYPGDKKYAPSNATTSFTVSRKTTNLTVDITNNDDLTGNILVKTDYTDCTGEVGVYINNDPVLIMNLTDGSCNFPVKFKRGTNYIYILYLGDDVYSHVSWNTTSIIEGRAIINTTDNVFNEQEPGTYIISLFDTDGNPYEYTNITVVFKNQTITLTTDENGTAKLPIQSRAGKYNITVSYKNNTYSDIITVNPARIIIDIKDILANEVEVITATLPDGASGNITLIVDNTIINQSSTLSIPNLSVGEHNLTVIYSGDDNYINQTIQIKFSIKNAISGITISSSNITYGEEVSVTGWVTAGATGTVTFTLNNQTQTVNLTGNQAKAIFKNIPSGNHIITARYNGDNIYQGSGDTIQVNVKKATPTITVKTTPLVLNTNIQIDAVLNDDATGNVTFRIQGQYSPRNRTIINGNASWLISPLNTGSYNLIVTYNGDNNYESRTVSEILVLNQVRTVLKVSIANVNEDDDLIVTATLTDINNQKLSGDLVLEINGNYYRIIITNGEGSRNLGEFKAGKYDFTATYQGTDLLSMSTSTGTFNVIANNYKITENRNIVQYYGANKEYKVQVLNNNVPVKNAIVSIKINKNTVNVKTDSQGYATLKLSLKAGKYTITSTYKNIKVSNKITVKPTLITKNKKIKKGKTLTYTAKLLNKNGKKLKNKKITFKINGKKYKAKTNKKGIAKIKVKNLKKGKYKIKTTYGKQKNTNTITVK